MLVPRTEELRLRVFRDKNAALKCAATLVKTAMAHWWDKNGYALEEIRHAFAKEAWMDVLTLFQDYNWPQRLGVTVDVVQATVE